MKNYLAVLAIFIPSLTFAQQNLKLWYKQPAKEFTEALPLGNGRLGAMVYGGVKHELIQLNEATLWSGGPMRTNMNPGAYANLLLAREALLKNEDYAAGDQLARNMQGNYSDSYFPLGNLSITQDLPGSDPAAYYRDLDIKNAITTTRFTIGGITYTRQMISSAPDQVMVIRFTASRPGAISFKLATSNVLKHQNVAIANNGLAMRGKVPAHIQPNYINTKNPIEWDDSLHQRGMRYELLVKAVNKGGSVSTDTSGITVKNADEVLVYLSAATSFNGFDKSPVTQGQDENKLATKYLAKALMKAWPALLSAHTSDYHHYFNRVNFNLAIPADNSNATLPTNERLIKYTNGVQDPSFETLYFQYNRYLLISCSRPGGMPANLQGIWNKDLRPAWSSNYTTNINAQMNYWPAEEANLSEMQLPFIDYIKNAAVTGKITATQYYHARGWAVHHNSDIWAISNPVGEGTGDPRWANWAMGSPWLSQHLWWHYQFTQDKNYLRQTAYPLMKSAAQFCMDWLVPHQGYLVTAPSVSPENAYRDQNGKEQHVSIATTMDMSIIRDLFTNVISASNILGYDKAFRDSIIAKQALLYPLRIGKKGNLQEWYKDYEDIERQHRHVSHLFGLFPGAEISPVKTPEFTAAAKKALELRGDGGTGWSLAWKINFWARLLDGNHAYKMIRAVIHHISGEGGSYPNLFDSCPPFQIDGNFGSLSGMCEMLLQSQSDEINMLPALPDAWAEGTISGLKARGNFTVDMDWKNKRLVSASVLSVAGGACRIRTANPVKVAGIAAKSTKTANGYITTFTSKKGLNYRITAI